jgi:thiamine-monophosphate kinase
VAGLTEDAIIGLFRPLARHPGAFGLVDDCAALTPKPGTDLVLKADAIVAGIHFFPDDPAADVARKALRVNLSDLAAKGARPLGFLLSLVLPAEIDRDWLAAFAQGLGEDAEQYDCPLLGGDTDRTTGPVVVSITVFGELPIGSMLRRDLASEGEHLVVTGTIGDAALGLLLCKDASLARRWGLTDRQAQHLVSRYHLPQPRNAAAEALRQHAKAGMDVSDGLVGDLAKMTRASHVSAAVEIARVPLSEAAQAALAADPKLIEPILTGGDDYEVLATAPIGRLDALTAAAAAAGVAISNIGRITAGGDPTRFIDASGTVLTFRQGSYSHF